MKVNRMLSASPHIVLADQPPGVECMRTGCSRVKEDYFALLCTRQQEASYVRKNDGNRISSVRDISRLFVKTRHKKAEVIQMMN